MRSLIISVGLCGFIHRPLTNTARPDSLRPKITRPEYIYPHNTSPFSTGFPQTQSYQLCFFSHLINEQNTLHSYHEDTSEYIHEQKYTKNWYYACGKKHERLENRRIHSRIILLSPVRIIHEQFFIHECKSLFLRDHSGYKIFLCEYTLTHSNNTHYILRDNDVSYAMGSLQYHLDVSFGLRFQS